MRCSTRTDGKRILWLYVEASLHKLKNPNQFENEFCLNLFQICY